MLNLGTYRLLIKQMYQNEADHFKSGIEELQQKINHLKQLQ